MRKVGLLAGLSWIVLAAACGANEMTTSPSSTTSAALSDSRPFARDVVFRQVTEVHDGVKVVTERTATPDLAWWLDAALGLAPMPDGLLVTLETGLTEVGATDDRSGVLTSTVQVVVEPAVERSVKERLASVDDAKARGLISPELAYDRRVNITADRLRAETAPPRLSAKAEQWLADVDEEGTETTVQVCSAPLASLQLPDRALKNEILYGLDREAAQATLEPLVAARDAELAAHLKALRAVPAVAGVRERFASTQRPCITGEASAATIRELGEASEVHQLLVGEEAEPDGQGEAAGDVVRAATQTRTFHQQNNTGDIAPTRSPSNGFARLTVGVIDRGLQDFHRAFRDTSSQTTGDRIIGRFQCNTGSSCTASANLPYDPVVNSDGDSQNDHGTRVTGIILGDLVDAQDSSHSTTTARQERTFLAAEAQAVLLNGGRGISIDKVASLRTDVANFSGLLTDGTCGGKIMTLDAKCRGTTASATVNDAYDAGVFFVKSAGNNGPSTTDPDCTCTLTSPADAEGTFSVASLSSACPQSEADLRQATIHPGSSEGGGELGNFPSITRERTLVGLAAPTQHCNVSRCDFNNSACEGTTPVSFYGSSGSGTSFAAPVVSGAAILAKHRWIALSSPASYLDHAGRLRAHMLLMGDRLANDGTSKLVKAYSTKYGAGRLRQRYFSGPGMDSPWDQRAGSVTLSNGQFFQRWVTPTGSLGTIPSDASRLVVVGWWFETNLAQAADFTMTIDTFDPTCTNLISTTSDSSADTRKRIWQIPYQGNCYRLGFEAVNIPSGTRTIYWNYYWEDSDRDDADGPSLAEVEVP